MTANQSVLLVPIRIAAIKLPNDEATNKNLIYQGRLNFIDTNHKKISPNPKTYQISKRGD